MFKNQRDEDTVWVHTRTTTTEPTHTVEHHVQTEDGSVLREWWVVADRPSPGLWPAEVVCDSLDEVEREIAKIGS